MAKSTVKRAVARFRQLSCSGLDRKAVIPELLKELHALVPSFSNSFFFADGKAVVTGIYVENPAIMKMFPVYEKEYFELRERAFKGLAFSDAARMQIGVADRRQGVATDEATFNRSDYYNLLGRAAGYDSNFLRLYFREGGRVLGGVTLWRAPNRVEWTPEDRRRLAALESYFTHALTTGSPGRPSLVDSGETGLIIADQTGKPLHFTNEGRRLLFLATSPRSMPGTSVGRSNVLPTPVAELCRRLARVYSDDPADVAPVCYHSNGWGGFTFRAHWLDRGEPDSGMVAITVTHQVPLQIRLMRSAGKLPLSARQAEVCVLMASGASIDAIAERLGVSRNTANDHGRAVFQKLGVHSRSELVGTLLRAPGD